MLRVGEAVPPSLVDSRGPLGPVPTHWPFGGVALKGAMMATIETAPRLPNAAELKAAWTALADVEEQLLEPTMRSVFEALNYSGEQQITFEQIGRLAAWADDVQAIAGSIVYRAANVKEAAVRDLPSIADEGRNPNAPRFTG